jgi:hypothetical protein
MYIFGAILRKNKIFYEEEQCWEAHQQEMQYQQHDEADNVPVGEVLMDKEIIINNNDIINENYSVVDYIIPTGVEGEAEENAEVFR